MNEFAFKGILQKEGWVDNVVVKTDVHGIIISINSEVDSSMSSKGFALPGFQNAHSHAFQYAMAGLAELHSVAPGQNDFWSWRNSNVSNSPYTFHSRTIGSILPLCSTRKCSEMDTRMLRSFTIYIMI